jgi:uncharacterized protein
MKKALRLGLLWGAMASAAWAVDWKALRPQGYVSDFAGAIDTASKAQLEEYCALIERSTGAQMALVTVPSLEGEPIEDVANTIFRGWGVGQKGANEGILMLLAIGDRRSRLEVGYGLEPIITDGDAGSVLRAMAPELRGGQYGAALVQGALEVGSRIAQAKKVAVEAPAGVARRQRPHPAGAIVPLALFGVIGFLVLMVLAGRGRGGGLGWLLTGMILDSVMGGSRSYRDSGGGFGGYDSGGGFGGFGGGDSGGGGASGSW